MSENPAELKDSNVKQSYKMPTAEELLNGRPAVQQVQVEYSNYGYCFTLRQIIDANVFGEIGRQAGVYTKVEFTNPLTKEKFYLDFNQAYSYAQLQQSLVDPDDVSKHPFTIKQLVEIGCIHGSLIIDLKWRASKLSELDAQVEELKND